MFALTLHLHLRLWSLFSFYFILFFCSSFLLLRFGDLQCLLIFIYVISESQRSYRATGIQWGIMSLNSYSPVALNIKNSRNKQSQQIKKAILNCSTCFLKKKTALSCFPPKQTNKQFKSLREHTLYNLGDY